MPEDILDRMPEDMPARMLNKILEDMLEYMLENMLDRIPDRIPENMLDRMLKDLSIRKFINVMVGITRSKVFFFLRLDFFLFISVFFLFLKIFFYYIYINFYLYFSFANFSLSFLLNLFVKIFADFPPQYAPLDLNLGPSQLSMHRWTSTWDLPSSVCTAGPQSRTFPAGPQPGTCPAQCTLLDLNWGPSQLNVHRYWTSTWDLANSVCTAGPQRPDRMPENMPDRMPENLSDRMPEDMPDRMPEGISNKILNKMP